MVCIYIYQTSIYLFIYLSIYLFIYKPAIWTGVSENGVYHRSGHSPTGIDMTNQGMEQGSEFSDKPRFWHGLTIIHPQIKTCCTLWYFDLDKSMLFAFSGSKGMQISSNLMLHDGSESVAQKRLEHDTSHTQLKAFIPSTSHSLHW